MQFYVLMLPSKPAECDDKKKMHVSPGVMKSFEARIKTQYGIRTKIDSIVPKFYTTVNAFTEKVKTFFGFVLRCESDNFSV